jgi:hypothetical protein
VKNDDYNWANKIERLEAENAELKAQIKTLIDADQIKPPDFIYDQHDWENTYDIADFAYLLDGVPNYEVVSLQTLRIGPEVFAVGGYFCPRKWFYTVDAAMAYADQLRVEDGDE